MLNGIIWLFLSIVAVFFVHSHLAISYLYIFVCSIFGFFVVAANPSIQRIMEYLNSLDSKNGKIVLIQISFLISLIARSIFGGLLLQALLSLCFI